MMSNPDDQQSCMSDNASSATSNIHPPRLVNHNDEFFMARAIRLAWKGRYTTMPNPRVGCVLVRDGQIIGEGWHERAGEPHAEINALKSAGQAEGATAYVTLEPCSHHGRTGPCADALVAAGITRLVVAMQDPNPEVSGRGIARCKAAGMDVTVGVCEQAAKDLNPGFISRMKYGLPFVRIKLASSLDGRTAMASGESQWITGAAAREDVQRIRARSSAIVSGIGSILLDDSRLTVRLKQQEGNDHDSCHHPLMNRQPLRIIVDSQLRLPVNAKVIQQPGRTLVVTCCQDAQRIKALQSAGAEILYQQGVGQFRQLQVTSADHAASWSETGLANAKPLIHQPTPSDEAVPESTHERIDLKGLLKYLAREEQCNELLVETGATLAGAFIEEELADECVIYMAPTLLGSSGRPLLGIDINRMADQKRVDITSMRAVGDDWRMTIKLNRFE
ncbi:Riboflavin biosynthesis protein RibD [Halomonadaceae bacterium LMG 33818]|uniref:bifunctional diaminohydroxyphosphoribosylaminopyrimidine deaminase/5-amino-6-(5-phosphoribosylamino)uracil reductase RibD n=1 Tax=Cernens ardua TaxID=3402176 RepID=UPI003EDCB0B9